MLLVWIAVKYFILSGKIGLNHWTKFPFFGNLVPMIVTREDYKLVPSCVHDCVTFTCYYERFVKGDKNLRPHLSYTS